MHKLTNTLSLAIVLNLVGCTYESSIIMVDAPPAPIVEEDTGTEVVEDTGEAKLPSCQYQVVVYHQGVTTMGVRPIVGMPDETTSETVKPEFAKVATFGIWNANDVDCPAMTASDISIVTDFSDLQGSGWTPSNVALVDVTTGLHYSANSEWCTGLDDRIALFNSSLTVEAEGSHVLEVWMDLTGAANMDAVLVTFNGAKFSDGQQTIESLVSMTAMVANVRTEE